MKFVWENIFNQGGGSTIQISTDRARVVGGWIVRTSMAHMHDICESTVFVPDVDSNWTIDNEEK